MLSAFVAFVTPAAPVLTTRYVWPSRRLSMRMSTARHCQQAGRHGCDALRVHTAGGFGGRQKRIVPLGQHACRDHCRGVEMGLQGG